MKKFIDRIKIKPYSDKLTQMYFDNKKVTVFDIETTGLNPAVSHLMLSGFLTVEGDEAIITQLFAENPEEEKAVLLETIKILSEADYVLTYNGRHFDIPYIKKRAQIQNIQCPDMPYNLDLYLTVNGSSDLKAFLPDLKQKSVEVFMGVSSSRDDKISGKENIDLYDTYLQTGSKQIMNTILLHNHDDLIQLYRIFPVIKHCDFHKAMYNLGFPAGKYIVRKIHTEGTTLRAEGEVSGNPKSYISFPDDDRPYSLTIDEKSKAFNLEIPCFKTNGCLVCDIAQLLQGFENDLDIFPEIVNGYAILRNQDQRSFMEINALLKAFITKRLPEIM